MLAGRDGASDARSSRGPCAGRGSVGALKRDSAALDRAGPCLIVAIGDTSEEVVAGHTADLAEGVLADWNNNAAIYSDASLHAALAREALEFVTLNLGLAVVGSATAVRRFLATGEGLTRPMTVDSGPSGVRTNAVALGSMVTERYEAFLEGQDPAEAARIEGEMRRLHPICRIGRPEEEAGTVPHLLSGELHQRRDHVLGRGISPSSAWTPKHGAPKREASHN